MAGKWSNWPKTDFWSVLANLWKTRPNLMNFNVGICGQSKYLKVLFNTFFWKNGQKMAKMAILCFQKLIFGHFLACFFANLWKSRPNLMDLNIAICGQSKYVKISFNTFFWKVGRKMVKMAILCFQFRLLRIIYQTLRTFVNNFVWKYLLTIEILKKILP